MPRRIASTTPAARTRRPSTRTRSDAGLCRRPDHPTRRTIETLKRENAELRLSTSSFGRSCWRSVRARAPDRRTEAPGPWGGGAPHAG
jgi:nitroreductase